MYSPSFPGGSSPWKIYQDENKDLPEAQYPTRPMPRPMPALAPPSPQLPVLGNTPSGSGYTREATSEGNEKYTGGTTTGNWADPMKMRQIAAGVASLPEVQEQKRQQALNQELFRTQLQQRQQPDLATPLANLSDYVSTGQLGDRKGQVLSPKDHATMIREWSKQQQDDQRDITKMILNGASAYKAGLTSEQYMMALANKSAEKNQDPAMGAKAVNPTVDYNKWIATTDRDPIIKKTPGMIETMGHARHMLEGNTPVDASNFRYELLQGLGVPRITNYELAGEQGTKALWGKLDQKLETLTSGRLTDENKRDYMQLIDGITAAHRQVYDQHRQFHTQRGVVGYGIAPDKAAVGINSLEAPTGQGKVPTIATPPKMSGRPSMPASSGGDAGMDAFLKSGN